MRGFPIPPSHVKHWDHRHSLTLEISSSSLTVQVIPNRAGLAIDHGQHVIQQAEHFEREETATYEGIEPDPRAALDSIGNEEWSATYGVVDNMMISQHLNGVCAGFVSPLHAQD